MPEINLIVTQPDVSIVIGNKGVQIKALEQQTNTKIHLQNDTNMMSRDFFKLRNFRILGDRQDLVKGVVKIVAGTLTKEHDSPFLQCFLLPGGETDFTLREGSVEHNEFKKELAELNEGTRSRIRPVELSSTGIFGIEILSISEEDMMEAVEKIMDMYQSQGVLQTVLRNTVDRDELLRLAKAPIDEQMEFLKEKEIIAFLIPEEKTSFLIGPKGASIKELETAFDVKLVVERPQAPFFETGRAVICRGEVTNICECLAAAMDKIFEKDNIEPRVVCLLPSGVPRYLIGHAGENIRRIEQESGCSLTVQPAQPRPGFPMGGAEMKYCQIMGPRENIVKGIQGVAARIIFQLFLRGQSSHGAIPEHSDFGVFGNFGRPVDAKGMSFGRQSGFGSGSGPAAGPPRHLLGRATTMRPGVIQTGWGATGDASRPWYTGAEGGNERGMRWSPGGRAGMVGTNGARDGYGAARGMRQPQNRYY